MVGLCIAYSRHTTLHGLQCLWILVLLDIDIQLVDVDDLLCCLVLLTALSLGLMLALLPNYLVGVLVEVSAFSAVIVDIEVFLLDLSCRLAVRVESCGCGGACGALDYLL